MHTLCNSSWLISFKQKKKEQKPGKFYDFSHRSVVELTYRFQLDFVEIEICDIAFRLIAFVGVCLAYRMYRIKMLFVTSICWSI